MTDERYNTLNNDLGLLGHYIADLTSEEINEGYHFCYEWDGLLIGPGMPELRVCQCLPYSHNVYFTMPSNTLDTLNIIL